MCGRSSASAGSEGNAAGPTASATASASVPSVPPAGSAGPSLGHRPLPLRERRGRRGNERVLRDRDVDSGGDGLVVDLGALFKSELRERPRQLGAGEPLEQVDDAGEVVAGGDAGCARHQSSPARRRRSSAGRWRLAFPGSGLFASTPYPAPPRGRSARAASPTSAGVTGASRHAGKRVSGSGLPRASAYVATCSRSAPRS